MSIVKTPALDAVPHKDAKPVYVNRTQKEAAELARELQRYISRHTPTNMIASRVKEKKVKFRFVPGDHFYNNMQLKRVKGKWIRVTIN